MPYKLKISLPEKLMLSSSNKFSRILLTAGHLFLAINMTSAYLEILPIIGIILAALCFCGEYYRKQIIAQEAVNFGFSRLVTVTMVVIATVMLTPLYFPETAQVQIWNALFFTLGPLSFYDAFQTANGKLGIRPFFYIRKRIQNKMATTS